MEKKNIPKGTDNKGTDNKSAAIKKRDLKTIVSDILKEKAKEAKSVLAIGQYLIEAKEQVEHGEWGDWLKVNVSYCEETARRYMRLANGYSSNSKTLADLGQSKAYTLLKISETEREAFMNETHFVNTVENPVAMSVLEMSTRQLENVIQEYKDTQEKQKGSGSLDKKPTGTVKAVKCTKPVEANEAVETDEDDETVEATETETAIDADLKYVHLSINSIIAYIADQANEADKRKDLATLLREICVEALKKIPSAVV
jgi:hypothetical protein